MFPNPEYMETVRTWVAANRANDQLARTSHYQWASRWLASYDRDQERLARKRFANRVALVLCGLALAAWLWLL